MKRNLNFTGIKDYAVDYIEGKIFDMMSQSLKNHFGREFIITTSTTSCYNEVLKNIYSQFLGKYDTKLNNRMQRTAYKEDNSRLINMSFFVKLRNDTYMFVLAGRPNNPIMDMMNFDRNSSPTDLYIYIFGKKSYAYAKELDKIIKLTYANDDLGIYIVNSSSSAYSYGDDDRRKGGVPLSLDISYTSLAPRYLNTLFFSHNEKEIICHHIEQFNANEAFYKEKQLLYKTGILLYGCPGTGKTSLVKALATEYNRSIIQITCSNLQYIDLNKLTSAINVDVDKRYIILFEDIDSLFLNNTEARADKDEEAIINKLLQFLDSNVSPTNVIFIATTNHKDRLSESLLREGRFDLKVEVRPLEAKEAYEFGNNFGVAKDDVTEIINDISNDGHDINQSKLQTRLLAKVRNISTDKANELWSVEEQ